MHFRQILTVAAESGGASYDADAVTYFDAVVTAGGAALDASHKAAISNLVTGLKADSLWTRLDRLWLFANQHATAALLDIKGLDTATAVNTPTFTADQGYAGNGSTSYVNTTFNPSTHGSQLTQNSAHMMLYCRTARTGSGDNFSGAGGSDGSNYAILYPRYGGVAYAMLNDGGGGSNANATVANASGCFIGSRTSSSLLTLYRNGSSVGSNGASTSTGLANVELYVGGFNLSGVLTDASTDQHAVLSAGASLDATQAANLNTRIEAYMDALGTGVQ